MDDCEDFMKHELLAPAGNIEAGYAALYYGADAVYLGLSKFSARAGAQNFTFEELDEFCAYAHSIGRKVFVAVNTILSEKELEDLPQMYAAIDKAKVDALIVQDMGVFYLAKKMLPNVEMHASTQMAVHNLEGAEFLASLGFKRIVLARELTIAEIKKITQAMPDVDFEVFVHGALCYSYSGQCLFSALEYGMSANRGRCVYPCRSEFCVDKGQKSHLFSMKDLALEEKVLQIPALSLKIEGRKKSPLYVAAVTNYYRHILDGKPKDKIEAEDIKQIFSRPWCKFHFEGKNKDIVDKNFVGHRGLIIGKVEKVAKGFLFFKTSHKIARYDGLQIDAKGFEKPFGFGIKELFVRKKAEFEAAAGSDVQIKLPPQAPEFSAGAPVYLASSSEVKGKYSYEKPKKGEFCNEYHLDAVVEISFDAVWAMADNAVFSVKGKFEPAKNVEQVANAAKTSFAKTGGSGFVFDDVEVRNPDGLFVPVSMFNELRRGLLANVKPEQKDFSLPALKSCANSAEISKNIKVVHIEADTDPADLKSVDFENVWLVLPQICRNVAKIKNVVDALYSFGARKFVAENWYVFEILKKYKDVEIGTGSFLYVMNRYCAEQLRRIGAKWGVFALESSPENMKELAKVSPLPLVQVISARPPLFTSAVCVRQNSCEQCTGGTKTYKLEKDGKTYSAVSKNCQVQVFAAQKYVREKIEGAAGYFASEDDYI